MGAHELQVVNANSAQIRVIAHHAAGLGAQLGNGNSRGVINHNLTGTQFIDGILQALHVLHGHAALLGNEQLLAHAAPGIEQTLHQLHAGHFAGEDENRLLHIQRQMLHDIEQERSLTHGRTRGDNEELTTLQAVNHGVQARVAGGKAQHLALAAHHALHVAHSSGNIGAQLPLTALVGALADFQHGLFRLIQQSIYLRLACVGRFACLIGSQNDGAAHVLLLQRLEMQVEQACIRGIGEHIHETGSTTHSLQLVAVGQVLHHRGHINRYPLVVAISENFPQYLMRRNVEEIRRHALGYTLRDDIGWVNRHHGQQALLHIRGLRHDHVCARMRGSACFQVYSVGGFLAHIRQYCVVRESYYVSAHNAIKKNALLPAKKCPPALSFSLLHGGDIGKINA